MNKVSDFYQQFLDAGIEPNEDFNLVVGEWDDMDTLFKLRDTLNENLDTLKTINHVYKDQYLKQYLNKIQGIQDVINATIKEQLEYLAGVDHD